MDFLSFGKRLIIVALTSSIIFSMSACQQTDKSLNKSEKTNTEVENQIEKTEVEETEVGNQSESSSVRYIQSIFTDIEVEKDIEYKKVKNHKGDMETLLLDIYQPSGDKELQRPAIIWVHGGGFRIGNKDGGIEQQLALEFAKKGYVTVCINYRLRENPENDWRGTFIDATDDAYSAFDWLVKNSEKYRIDTKHIAYGGHSAGGATVINLCYKNDKSAKKLKESVFSVIDLAGGQLWMGTPNKDYPPCVIIHGTNDELQPYRDSESLARVFEETGVNYDLHPVEGAPHDLSDYFFEVEDTITKFLFKALTGTEADIKVRIGAEETLKSYVKTRLASSYKYTAKQIDFVADGVLDEWGESNVMPLTQLKDAGKQLPAENDFSGSAMMGWNENDPDSVYLAVTVTDSHVEHRHSANENWWENSCLEFLIDVSNESITTRPVQWGFDANGADGYGLASDNKTNWKVKKEGNKYIFEAAIKLSELNSQVSKDIRNFRISAGKTVGISIQYDKPRNGIREYQIGWTPGATLRQANFGNLTFSSEKAKK